MSVIDEDATDALQGALAAEHAALWCYGLAVAFLGPQQRVQARDDAAAHRVLRAAVETTLGQLGTRAGCPPPRASGRTAACPG